MAKILFFTNRLVIGGPSVHLLSLIRHFSKTHKICLVYGQALENEASMEDDFKELNISMHQIQNMKRSLNPLPDFITCRRLHKKIKEFQPDIIHTHTFKPGVLGRICAKINNIPKVIHTYHGLVFEFYFSKFLSKLLVRLDRYLAKSTDCLVALSANQKNNIITKYKITTENKVQIIPLSIDQNKDSFTKQYAEQYRKKIGVQQNTLLLAMIGRLVDVKNIAQTIKVFAELKNKMELNDVVLQIIGNGELQSDLVSLAKSKGLNVALEKADNVNVDVVFISWQRDLSAVYSALDLLVLSSKNEGTPLSIIEAQMAQTAILAPRVGGIENIVEENKTALLFTTEKQMKEQMKYYFENRDIISEYGKNAVNFASKEFSSRKMFDSYSKLYS